MWQGSSPRRFEMTKAELVALVATQAGTTNADAERVLDGFRDVIQA